MQREFLQSVIKIECVFSRLYESALVKTMTSNSKMNKDLLHTLRTKIKTWEDSWIEIKGQNDEKRRELVEEIQAIGELNKTVGDEKVASLLEAFASSLEEQAKYEDWASRMSEAVFFNPSIKAQLIAEREAALQVYRDNDQFDIAPEWLFDYFNPRLGPAKPIAYTD